MLLDCHISVSHGQLHKCVINVSFLRTFYWCVIVVYAESGKKAHQGLMNFFHNEISRIDLIQTDGKSKTSEDSCSGWVHYYDWRGRCSRVANPALKDLSDILTQQSVSWRRFVIAMVHYTVCYDFLSIYHKTSPSAQRIYFLYKRLCSCNALAVNWVLSCVMTQDIWAKMPHM